VHVSALARTKYALFASPLKMKVAHYRRRKTHDQSEHLSYAVPVLSEEEKQWINQRLENLETTWLTECHKWASPVESRQRSHAAVPRARDSEVESL